MTIELMEGDCLDLMWRVPSGSVDAIVCDLPFKATACAWDSIIPFEPLWAHYKRVTKRNAAIVLFGKQPFTSLLVVSNLALFKYELIYGKNRPSGHYQARRQFMKRHENILIFYDEQPTYNPQMVKRTDAEYKAAARFKDSTHRRGEQYGRDNGGTLIRKSAEDQWYKYPASILEFKRDDTRNSKQHSARKPVALLEYLIRTFTNEGETVMDNCMGSGSTGVACVNLCRSFIGIEKDPHYFEMARKRIESDRVGTCQTEPCQVQATLFAG